jgi:RHS repeat-associated protein
MFTGQYYDSEIAEYYLRARQYDPHIARFTARDLVFGQFEEPLTLHRYLYCRNNPVNMVDPQGLWTFHIQGSVSATMIGSFVVQAGIVIDDNGNVGWMVTRSRLNIPGGYDDWVGFGTPSVSAGIAIGGTNADTIFDLQGRGLSIGGSVKLPMLGMVTGDFLTGNQRNGNPYYGFEITPGFLLSPLLCEVHVQQTETTVSPWNWNYRNSFENLKNSLEESIFETKTLGEAYMVFFAMGLMDRYD